MFFLISGNASGTGGASSGGKDGGLSEKINEKIDKCNRGEECKQGLRDAGWSLSTEYSIETTRTLLCFKYLLKQWKNKSFL